MPDTTKLRSRSAGASFESFLMEQYGALVQFLQRRTVSRQDAEDAAQTSLSRLLRYKDSAPASTWKPLLYRIATNVAIDQWRTSASRRTDKHESLTQHVIVSEIPTPEEQLMRDQQLARLSQAILDLPPKCQRVYLLKRVHGLTRSQIANRCDISVKMVEKHLATALAKLRKQVGDADT